jgi:hypothetical protein
MPQTRTRARTEVLTRVRDAAVKQRPDPRTWSHLDGRPFSKGELDLVSSAADSELEDLHGQIARYQEYRRAKEEAPEAITRFLAPFSEQLTEKNLSNALSLMNQEERAEFNRLLDLLLEPLRPFTLNTF